MGAYARQRAMDRIAELSGRGHDLVTFWQEATEAIARAVPFHLTPCFYTLDPATLLATSHYHDGLPEIPPAWLALEYSSADFNQMAVVARSTAGVGTLDEATGGDVSRSAKYRETMRPFGADQEVIAALRTGTGDTWGALALYRAPGRPRFEAAEIEFLREVSPHLAAGARRGLLIGEATEPEGPHAPGLVVLNESWEIESMTPGVERWLEEMPGGHIAGGILPPAVLAVAGRARRNASDSTLPGEIAFSRVLTQSGQWVVLHGASLVTGGPRRIAVIVESAHPARITPLLMSAYGLTQREQDVTRLVLQGESTAEIANQLFVSPHTVQEHLKNVFEKTGVRSRRELVSKVFFAHYEPRLRDNERRAVARRPARGGPMPRL